ncbi:MAG: ABC transporter substrate-binding protein [Oscillospiraceae bacterium]|jgi:spermidine/putrescine transport system substrate-binding protein|nr:ABC transporter substrate-binding protein [Oscillospiraceae bacterium]
MKNKICALIALSLAAALLIGCAKTPASGDSTPAPSAPAALSGEVNVYNWGEYIDESLLAEFETQTGVRVNYMTFQNNEEMYASLRLGGSEYDVIIPSDYMVSRMIAEDMLEKLDFANIPNAALIGDRNKAPEYDPAGEYSVAYMTGTVGLIYDSSFIADGDIIDSWSFLFDPAYSGEILMIDNPRDAFGIALKYLGYSLNTTNKDEIQEAYKLLSAQKPLLQAYVMDTIFDKMEGGEAAFVPYYAGDYITMKESNPNLRFVLPREGSNVFADAMCIPKGAANKRNAEAFINFMTATDSAARNMEVTGYVSANAEASKSYAENYDEADRAVLFPADDELADCESFINLPQDILTLYDELWVSLKA